MKFEIGNKVKCIDANTSFINVSGNIPPLKEGNTCIVNNIFICSCGAINLDVGISSKKEYQYCNKS